MLKQRTGRGYPVSTYLPVPVADAMDRAVDATGMVRNQLLREIIEEWLKGNGYLKEGGK